jgi:predicted nucleic acid-binding protein
VLLVDTNIIIDVLGEDPVWSDRAARQMRFQSRVHELVINPLIYAELSPSFASVPELDASIDGLELTYRELPRTALFVAGVAHRHYRKAGGPRQSILADFLIGAHAAVMGCGILTRDPRRYRSYFPAVEVIAP